MATAKKTAATGQVEARVLITGYFGKVDSIVLVDSDVANESPDLDPTPEAVAYAKTLATVAE